MNPDILISLCGGVISNPLRRLSAPASFELRRGECIAVVGPNGSGKSTLLEMLRGGFYLREGSLRFGLGGEAYKCIRTVTFDNAYSTTETQYYHHQRWQAFEREASPLAGELLGVAGFDTEAAGDGMGATGAGMGAAEAEMDATDAGMDAVGTEVWTADAGTDATGTWMGAADTGTGAAGVGVGAPDSWMDAADSGMDATATRMDDADDSMDTADKCSWQGQLLQVLSIRPLLGNPIITLSSGELRRFSLARALKDKPEVLILESPFIGLDPPTRQMLCELLKSVLAMGVSIVMTLTDIARIPDVVTHVYLMSGGRLSEKMPRTRVASSQESMKGFTAGFTADAETGCTAGCTADAEIRGTTGSTAGSKAGSTAESTASHETGSTADHITAGAQHADIQKDTEYTSHAFEGGDILQNALLQHFTLQPESRRFNTVVQMRDINIAYGQRQIFKNLNWTVHSGEKWNVTGPNGSGKSTLLSLVNADNPRAYSLDITLFDRRRGTGESIWDIKRHIGYLSSEMHSSFRESISVLDLLRGGLDQSYEASAWNGRTPAQEASTAEELAERCPAGALGKPADRMGVSSRLAAGAQITDTQAITKSAYPQKEGELFAYLNDNERLILQPLDAYLLSWLRLFGAEHLAQRDYLTLSSGEQRYVLLIRAFVKDPELLILDEPFQGLDANLRSRAAAVIKAFCSRQNKTLIFVTHYIDEIPDVVTHTLQL